VTRRALSLEQSATRCDPALWTAQVDAFSRFRIDRLKERMCGNAMLTGRRTPTISRASAPRCGGERRNDRVVRGGRPWGAPQHRCLGLWRRRAGSEDSRVRSAGAGDRAPSQRAGWLLWPRSGLVLIDILPLLESRVRLHHLLQQRHIPAVCSMCLRREGSAHDVMRWARRC